MPIYMDRHNMPEGISMEDVEKAHHADMQAQDKYKVNFLTYWFDQQDGAIFCLADCPDAEALKNVHGEAHGGIPHEIIEVNLDEVHSFLGRIKDPEKDETGHIPIESPLRTLMFTDLKGSTDMVATLGDTEAIRLLEIHDKIVRDEIAKYDGREIKTTGDGFLIAFDQVADAVRCGIAIQKAFDAYNSQTTGQPLAVRIGINAGHPVERAGDLYGIAVNLAARFCDHAKPGQILTSGIIYHLVLEETEIESRFIECERTYFKGFPNAFQVFDITWKD